MQCLGDLYQKQLQKKDHLMCSIASSLLKTLRRANGKRQTDKWFSSPLSGGVFLRKTEWSISAHCSAPGLAQRGTKGIVRRVGRVVFEASIKGEKANKRQITSEHPEGGEELVELLGLFLFFYNCIQNDGALTRKYRSCFTKASHKLPLSWHSKMRFTRW